jgi:hypothetical protein
MLSRVGIVGRYLTLVKKGMHVHVYLWIGMVKEYSIRERYSVLPPPFFFLLGGFLMKDPMS